MEPKFFIPFDKALPLSKNFLPESMKKLSPIIHQIVEKYIFFPIFNLDDKDQAKRTSLASFIIFYKDLLSKLLNFEKILTSEITKTLKKTKSNNCLKYVKLRNKNFKILS